MSLKFSGDCLKQNKVTYNHGKIVNIYIAYRLIQHTTSNTDFTINDSLFGAVKLTKDKDPDKCNYEGYGICFDSRSTYTHSDGNYAKNLIIFGCSLKNSVHATNRANNFLV